MVNYQEWIEKQWPSFLFFDPRLYKRVTNIASAMLNHPTASISERFPLQKDVKGCYRFLDNKSVNHQMLQRQHYENVLAEAAQESGRVLFIQDGSELIYNNLKWTELGPTADSSGNGIMFHSCLAVKFKNDQPQIIGLAGQKAWIRETKEDGADAKAQEEGVSGEMVGHKKLVPSLFFFFLLLLQSKLLFSTSLFLGAALMLFL